MVNRLADMDAVVMNVESSAPAHVVACVVLEASDQLSHPRLHELFSLSLPRMARFRSRVVGKPLGLGQPVWAEVHDFDPSPHLGCATVPAATGQRGFTDLIAGLTAEPLDRRKPLWQMWSIDGLDGGRWALALKMAPALSGGAAGLTAVWRHFLVTSPNDNPPSYPRAEPSLGDQPSARELIGDTMRELIENQVTGAWLIVGAVPGVVRGVLRRLHGPAFQLPRTPPSMRGPLPRTPFNLPLTDRRSTAFASIPFAQLKEVARAFGGSVDNVVLAACTLALRAWLKRHDAVPDEPLSLQVPLSVQDSCFARRSDDFAFGSLRFPVQLDDPVQVLTDLHTATEKLKMARSQRLSPLASLGDFSSIVSLLPPSAVHAVTQLSNGLGLSCRAAPASHGVVSILPGVRMPLYCAGARVTALHAAAPLLDRAGLNITMITHESEVHISVCVCPDNVPFVDEIASGIVESVALLVAAAEESPRGVSPSVLTEMTSHTKKRRHA